MTFITIFLIFLFLGISSYFSACETAITAASKARFHQLSKEGDKRAEIICHFKDHLGNTISVLLACNTALNSFIVALAAKIFIEYLGEKGSEIAAAVMALLILVYAEVMPKMLAILYSETLLLRSAFFFKFVFTIFKPLNHVIHWIARKSVRLIGLKITPTQANYEESVEELRGAIDLHTGDKEDVSHEKAMLKSILDLGSVTVSEIMTHRKNVTMLNASEPIDTLVDQILASPFTRLPLWKGSPNNIIGVVNAKALLRSMRKLGQINSRGAGGALNLSIEDIALKPWFVPENTDLLDQLQAFRSRREHFAFVVDEYGELLGIMTLEDILEEIVGDISDEHDIVVKGVRPQPDGAYVVDGSVTIRDLNRQLGWDLPDEDASTLAGFILYETRTIPNIGQVFSFKGYRFEILRRQRNQITLIKVFFPNVNSQQT